MNNEMLPFVVLLLQSEEQKKQLLQEVRTSADANKIVDGIIAKVNSGNFASVAEAGRTFQDTIESLKNSVDLLTEKLNSMEIGAAYKSQEEAL